VFVNSSVIEPPSARQVDADDTPEGERAFWDLGPRIGPEGRIVGGVCAVIARQLGLDALWIRIGFVLLALTAGLGLLVYAALWLVLVAAPRSGWTAVRVLGGIILIGGVPLALHLGNPRFLEGPPAVVLLLAGVAVALWQPRGERDLPSSPTPSEPPAAAPRPIAALRSSLARPRRMRSARERSILGRTALGLAVVAAAAGAIIDGANGGRLHPEQWLGVAAGVCGVGLLVGTIRGQARWLLLPALGFVAAGYVGGELARLGVGLGDLQGGRYIYVEGFSGSSQGSERIGFGDVSVNIGAAPTASAPRAYDVRTVFGDVVVSAQDDVAVDVRVRTDNGAAYADGRRVADGTIRLGPTGPADVTVDAWVGHGDVLLSHRPVVFHTPVTVAPVSEDGGVAHDEADDDIVVLSTLVPVASVVPGDDSTIAVDEYLTATRDGWFVLLDGAAVIDPHDEVVSGEQVDDDGSGVVRIMTAHGDFRLLPRGLLVRPDGEIVDLQALRAEIVGEEG
jgi:phage shock protein PspC (stress-responsive transcriptional regulator)